MEKVLKGIDRLNDGLAYLAAITLAATVVLILLEIFLWNTFQVSTIIADEYSAYGLAALVFLGRPSTSTTGLPNQKKRGLDHMEPAGLRF